LVASIVDDEAEILFTGVATGQLKVIDRGQSVFAQRQISGCEGKRLSSDKTEKTDEADDRFNPSFPFYPRIIFRLKRGAF
jgi:hypothetical protein